MMPGRIVFFLHRTSPGRCSVIAEILLAPITQPDSECLRNVFLLLLGESVVQPQGPFTFEAASPIAVGVPVGARESNAPGGFFDQSGSGEILVFHFIFLGRHLLTIARIAVRFQWRNTARMRQSFLSVVLASVVTPLVANESVVNVTSDGKRHV